MDALAPLVVAVAKGYDQPIGAFVRCPDMVRHGRDVSIVEDSTANDTAQGCDPFKVVLRAHPKASRAIAVSAAALAHAPIWAGSLISPAAMAWATLFETNGIQ